MSQHNSSPTNSDLESTANSDSAPLSATPTPVSHSDLNEESVDTSEDANYVVCSELQIYSLVLENLKKKK